MGGTRDEEAVTLPDDDIVRIVRAELQQILGLTAEPLFARRTSIWVTPAIVCRLDRLCI